jgi:hypothetical protein
LLISSVCSNSLLGFLGDEKSSASDLVHGAPSVPYHGPAITDDKVGQDAGLDDTMLTSVGVSLTEYNFKTGTRTKQATDTQDKVVVSFCKSSEGEHLVGGGMYTSYHLGATGYADAEKHVEANFPMQAHDGWVCRDPFGKGTTVCFAQCATFKRWPGSSDMSSLFKTVASSGFGGGTGEVK